MASNILSRLLPQTAGSPSVYERLREGDESSDISDIEERAGMALVDEENLAHRDIELDPALADAMDSHLYLNVSPSRGAQRDRHNTRGPQRRRWLQGTRESAEGEEGDDEVPLSLLIEGGRPGMLPSPQRPLSDTSPLSPDPVPITGPATNATRAKWHSTQNKQRLHQDPVNIPAYSGRLGRGNNLILIDRKEKALWRWANVENLDNFLKDVYDYFLGNGIWSILLSRVSNLL